jgi:hypothetical protein
MLERLAQVKALKAFSSQVELKALIAIFRVLS